MLKQKITKFIVLQNRDKIQDLLLSNWINHRRAVAKSYLKGLTRVDVVTTSYLLRLISKQNWRHPLDLI